MQMNSLNFWCLFTTHICFCMCMSSTIAWVEILTLIYFFEFQFTLEKDLACCPTFSNLKTFYLINWCLAGDLRALLGFLRCTPNLEKLTLQLCQVCTFQIWLLLLVTSLKLSCMTGWVVFVIFFICYRKINVYWKWKTAIQLNNHFLSGNLGESKLNVNRLMKGFGELWRSWVQLELVLRNLTSRRSRIQSFSVS